MMLRYKLQLQLILNLQTLLRVGEILQEEVDLSGQLLSKADLKYSSFFR